MSSIVDLHCLRAVLSSTAVMSFRLVRVVSWVLVLINKYLLLQSCSSLSSKCVSFKYFINHTKNYMYWNLWNLHIYWHLKILCSCHHTASRLGVDSVYDYSTSIKIAWKFSNQIIWFMMNDSTYDFWFYYNLVRGTSNIKPSEFNIHNDKSN